MDDPYIKIQFIENPEIVHTHSKDGHWKFQGRMGEGLIASPLKGKYETKLEVLRGVGMLKPKKHPWGRYGYFCNHTMEKHHI